jgi:hypothetical protein
MAVLLLAFSLICDMLSDEQLVNSVFYIFLFFISLGILGVDTSSLLVALSGLIVAFAFMIGPASSKYFEVGGWECFTRSSFASIERSLNHTYFAVLFRASS